MRGARLLVWPAALAIAVAAEWVGQPELLLLDAAAGVALLFGGLLGWQLRPETRSGRNLAAAGVAWFAGSLISALLYLHRGALAQAILSHPKGKLGSPAARWAIAAAYAYALVPGVATNAAATLVFSASLVALAVHRVTAARSPARRQLLIPLGAAVLFASALVFGATTRGAGTSVERAALWTYDLAVLAVGLGLTTDLVFGRWETARATGALVELGETGRGGLRGRLAQLLGDPTVELAYWLPNEARYVDELGAPVELPSGSASRALTPITKDGEPLAMLVHEPSVLDDPTLLASVSTAVALAVSNVRLQADLRTRVSDVEASRRRLVEVSDAQRRRLEAVLREGPLRRLERVGRLVASPSGGVPDEVRAQVAAARTELSEFARGVHPATLTDAGLEAALAELAARSTVAVHATVPPGRLPDPVEAGIYFVCSEALANVAKHAAAGQAEIRIVKQGERIVVEISDDGHGGADPSKGSGLRGLADRVEALGGTLQVDSAPGAGTRLRAELPLAPEA